MKRHEAIEQLLAKIKLDMLLKAAQEQDQRIKNYALKLFIQSINTTDTAHNWFTALAAMCIHHRFYAGVILQHANILSGNRLMRFREKSQWIDLIIESSKITKADAGRELNAFGSTDSGTQ